LGVIFLILHYIDNKKEKVAINAIINKNKAIYSADEYVKKKEIELLSKEECSKKELGKIKNEIIELDAIKKFLNDEINQLTNNIFIETVNVNEYIYITSEECKSKLEILKIKADALIEADKAIKILHNSSQGKSFENNKKQLLRCFNSECQNIFEHLSVKNASNQKTKIRKSFQTLNNIFSTDGVAISESFLEIKFQEFDLIYAYQLKREQEKEQEKAIREQMVEEEKVRREIEKEKQKIDKEESQFKSEIQKLILYMNKSTDEIQSKLYVDKIHELEEKLKLLEKDKENVLQREQNTRAGYVYIISNIGSFGENIFKIGMTRRLEPIDRIKELGDASVPFEFDVHALIFSEDAPTLEKILHQTFKENQVNLVNSRKEFYNIDLNKIKEVVLKNHNNTANFTMIPKAEDYRESLKLRSEIA
jgi:hypothetical protein